LFVTTPVIIESSIVSMIFRFRRTAYGYAERMLSAVGPAPRVSTSVERTVNR
jgi:hypothetical protein